MKGCGPGTVHKQMDNFRNKNGNSEKKLQKEMTLWMQSQLNLPEQAIDTFCKAFICEPCNESSDCCEKFCYIWKPKSLPTYLNEFLNAKKNKM